jgi:hypothetical protein
MMNTRKLPVALAALAVLLVTTSGIAQTKEPSGDSRDTRLGFGVSLGLPTNDAYNIAVGGDLRLQKDFYSNVSGLLSLGYTNFSVKNDGGSVGYVPLKAGIKVFPRARLYFSGEVGAAFGTDDGQGTALVYAPGIGLGFNRGIDLSLRYEGFSQNNANLGQVALRVAYGLNLSR